MPWLVSYAVGTLLGVALLVLLPEALAHLSARAVLGSLLAGIMLFFLLEKLVLWRHCHTHDCEAHGMAAPMVIIGDAFHNFLDGVVIGTAVRTSIPLGVSTALAVATHEIPQELGDMAILLHAGYSRRKAFLLNLVSGASAVLGAIVAVFALEWVPQVNAIRAVGRRGRFPVHRDGRSHSRSASRPDRRDDASSARAHAGRHRHGRRAQRIRGRTVMYALAIIRYRKPLEEVLVHQDAHRAYLRGLKEKGVLIASGPMNPRFGGLALLRVPTKMRKRSTRPRQRPVLSVRRRAVRADRLDAGYREGRSRSFVTITYSSTGRPPIRCSWMIRSSTGGSQPRYHVPSG